MASGRAAFWMKFEQCLVRVWSLTHAHPYTELTERLSTHNTFFSPLLITDWIVSCDTQ